MKGQMQKGAYSACSNSHCQDEGFCEKGDPLLGKGRKYQRGRRPRGYLGAKREERHGKSREK